MKKYFIILTVTVGRGMSYKKSMHEKEFASKYMVKLSAADIVFSTTSSRLSGVIKWAAGTPVSHVNLYSDRGKIIESSGSVKESSIHSELENSRCTRLIAFKNTSLKPNTRQSIVKAARKYKGRVWDGEQAIFHGLGTFAAVDVPALRTARLALKRIVVGSLTSMASPKRRQPLMCSTLIVYSYLDAGVKIDMIDAIFSGVDDLFNYCKITRGFQQVFDVSFTETGFTIN